MEIKQLPSPLSLQPFDPEVFQRVWRRVMPDQEHSPIALSSPAPSAPAAVSPVSEAERRHSCLGEASLPHTQALQNLMEQTHALLRTIQRLSRQAGPQTARVLSSLYAGLHQEQRRLSVAYFLITGSRCRPSQPALPLSSSLDGGLRTLFQAFQQRSAQALACADAVQDPCLHQLFQALGGQSEQAAARLRRLLEMLE